jgi:hypothetical protein
MRFFSRGLTPLQEIDMIRASTALASLQRALIFMAFGMFIIALPIIFAP